VGLVLYLRLPIHLIDCENRTLLPIDGNSWWTVKTKLEECDDEDELPFLHYMLQLQINPLLQCIYNTTSHPPPSYIHRPLLLSPPNSSKSKQPLLFCQILSRGCVRDVHVYIHAQT
jgi:hypothetical protein